MVQGFGDACGFVAGSGWSTGWVAAYYLFAGIICLLINSQTHVVAPWQMVMLFGVGQAALGFVLYWNVERKQKDQD